MQTHITLSDSISKDHIFLLIPILLWCFAGEVLGFGSMGPIAASTGDSSFFCAISAGGGNQEVLCWGSNNASAISGGIPAMFALSGGEGFLCGISSNSSQAFCWTATQNSDGLLVPPEFRATAYSAIAAGKLHVCAIRGPYYTENNSGTVDCWKIVKTLNRTTAETLTLNQTSTTFKNIVAGDGFTCGDTRDDGLLCFGPNSDDLKLPTEKITSPHSSLAASKSSFCAVSELTGELTCIGEIVNGNNNNHPPVETRFVSLSAGSRHFCGVREDDHSVECWGSHNSSALPKGKGFTAVASSELSTCGIREDDLVLDCWPNNNATSSLIEPPLELCSPGICSAGKCRSSGEFVFNASVLNEPDLTSLCARKDLEICSPCGSTCSEGLFLSSPCSQHSGRVCTACSLCQNDSCRKVCRIPQEPAAIWRRFRHIILISAAAASLLFAFALFVFFRCLRRKKTKSENFKSKKSTSEGDETSGPDLDQLGLTIGPTGPGQAQVFRLSELKDATNGFKEFSELGRGSYGFVYKAVLADGRHVAIKRANAATIIRSNGRDFEAELETLCKVRHGNIVNLLGYSSEMGERVLVYEYMPRGTLSDHLHGGLSPLSWQVRIRASAQAARGLEYLHLEGIVHRDVKSSNVLFDADWTARVADFGLGRDPGAGPEDDVYGFGVVLLEVLSGRKAFDRDLDPPGLVQWARPIIEQGRPAGIVDRYVALPRNVEPLLRLADVAELATSPDPARRPKISDISASLDQILRDGLVF